MSHYRLKESNGRPSSVPPLPHTQGSSVPPNRPSSIPSEVEGHHRTLKTPPNHSDGTSLDLMAHLQRSGPSVVKTRTGSVLSRGFILKTDYYPSGRALDLDLNVHGAPNFRAPRHGSLNVFGTAQPRTQGLRAILSVLRCHPNTPNPSHVVWFSTREEPIGACCLSMRCCRVRRCWSWPGTHLCIFSFRSHATMDDN